MKYILTALGFWLTAIPAFSQTQPGTPKSPLTGLTIGRLYGKIVEASTNAPVPYASVAVLKKMPGGADSLVGGALTKENGEFSVPNLPAGSLTVQVKYLGYKNLLKTVRITLPNDLEQDLGDLAILPDETLLRTVEVTADKAMTNLSLEKRVFNVDKNSTSAGGTAEDVMKSIPSVSVDVDGNVKLRDRGTTIYVDGKPTLLTLSQIPADQIESVEVISNPSAKYEASTSGGILNIVLKKNTKPGYNGLIAAGIGWQNRYNAMLNLNVNQGKFNVSGFYNLNASKNPSTGYAYRTNRNPDGSVAGYFNQNTDVIFQNTFQMGRVAVDYALNNRNTLTLSGTVMAGVFNFATDQNYDVLAAGRDTLSYGKRLTDPKNNFQNNSIQTDWKKTYARKGESLTVSGVFGWGTVSNVADWTTTGYDKLGQSLPDYPELVNISGANASRQTTFQADYVRPINDSTKLETGLRSFWSGKDQEYFYHPFNRETSAYELDPTFSQDSRINETVNAAYLSVSSRWKYGISYQAGLRFEQSSLNGDSKLDSVPSFGYHYPTGSSLDWWRSFFPSVYVSKKLDASSELGLNFSRKIGRPNYRQLMPGIQANDKQNVQYGNPDLQPEFVDLTELNYNQVFGESNWLSSLYFSNETNTLKPFTVPSPDDPAVLLTRFINGQNELMYGLDNTLKIAVGKNLGLLFNANVFNFKVNVDTFSNSGWAWRGKTNLTYKFPKDISVQINGNYDGNRPLPQGNRKGVASADFAVKKSFFHNAANITFAINDVFNSRRDISILDLPAYTQETMRRRDTRFFKLSVQVPFGKVNAAAIKKLREGRKSGGEDLPDFGG